MAGTYQNRFDRYEGGAVPQNVAGRTPEQQLAYLDDQKLVAAKERAKLLTKIAERVKSTKTTV